VLPCFPRGNCPIQLPLPPAIGVVSVKYLSSDGLGSLVTMGPADYRVIDGGFSGAQIFSTVTPAGDEPDAVRVTFVAGYESTESPADNPPETWRLASASLDSGARRLQHNQQTSPMRRLRSADPQLQARYAQKGADPKGAMLSLWQPKKKD
jgi:hypothetical protein